MADEDYLSEIPALLDVYNPITAFRINVDGIGIYYSRDGNLQLIER